MENRDNGENEVESSRRVIVVVICVLLLRVYVLRCVCVYIYYVYVCVCVLFGEDGVAVVRSSGSEWVL